MEQSDRTAKERMRRFRRRMKNGAVRIEAEMSCSLAESLVESGVLPDGDDVNSQMRGNALLAYLSSLARAND